MNISEKSVDFLCLNYIGIYYVHSEWKDNLYKKLLESIPSENIAYSCINSTEAYISLKSGTKIRICQELGFRGGRFHITYYEAGTPQEIIDTLIRPCMVYNYPQEITIVKEN